MVEQARASGPRRGRPGYDQETVLRRAVDLFNTQGYDATSIGDLARELGLTKSAIYHHVPSKEALLSAALDEALDGLTSAIDGAIDGAIDETVAGGGTAEQQLRAAVGASVRVLTAHLPAVTLLLRVRGNSDVELAALERRRLLDERLASLVRAAAEEGSIRDDLAPEVITRLLFGMVNSLVEWYSPGGAVHPDDLADAVTSLAFDGLLTAPQGG